MLLPFWFIYSREYFANLNHVICYMKQECRIPCYYCVKNARIGRNLIMPGSVISIKKAKVV